MEPTLVLILLGLRPDHVKIVCPEVPLVATALMVGLRHRNIFRTPAINRTIFYRSFSLKVKDRYIPIPVMMLHVHCMSITTSNRLGCSEKILRI